MAKLLAVQLAALNASAGRPGFAYWMEQGLGKTLTAETDFIERVAEGNASRSVVVAPNSFKQGWAEEIKKYDLRISPFVWDLGANDHELNKWAMSPTKYPKQLIINYEAIRQKRTQDSISAFIAGRKSFVIFDESIQISTHDSQQTIAAINLAKEFSYSRILSGKPMKQGPHDFWSQMRAAKQFSGWDYYSFRGMFCRMINTNIPIGKPIPGRKQKTLQKITGIQNEDILAERLGPHVFRATKAEWTDLPPKMWTTREYQMTPEMREQYKSMEKDFVTWLNEDEYVTIEVALTKFVKLAQIQGGWIYDEESRPRKLIEDAKNPRLRILRDTIDNELIGKSIVVYVHKPVLAQLQELLADRNPAFLHGGMSNEEITEQKRKFNEDPSCRDILVQMKVGKYGHTLLGGPEPANRCWNTYFYENTYSLDDRSQIEDRNHRIGQDSEKVLYTDFVGTPLDRATVEALQRKEDIFQALMRAIKG